MVSDVIDKKHKNKNTYQDSEWRSQGWFQYPLWCLGGSKCVGVDGGEYTKKKKFKTKQEIEQVDKSNGDEWFFV